MDGWCLCVSKWEGGGKEGGEEAEDRHSELGIWKESFLSLENP